MDYPLYPKAELFTWGPTPIRPFFGSIVRGLTVGFTSAFPGYGWGNALVLFKDKRMTWVQEDNVIRGNGMRFFNDFFVDTGRRRTFWEKWRGINTDLLSLGSRIEKTNLPSLSDAQFLELWDEYEHGIDEFWAYGTIPELSNYGSDAQLERKLRAIVPPEEVASAMEVLTAPEELSFYQKEEIELEECLDLAAHAQKYYWLRNSYSNIEWLDVEYFAQRRQTLPRNIRVEAQERIKKVREEKVSLIARYSIPDEIANEAAALCDGIIWQDERKEGIWRYLSYLDILATEAARRLGVKKDDLLNYYTFEIRTYLVSRAALPNLEKRKRGWGYSFLTNDYEKYDERFIDTDTALQFWDIYVEPPRITDAKEFGGIIASKGKGPVRGTVRVVLDPFQAEHFQTGDVLVTTMTTPEYIFVMKKAGAIITDTGGLTSHAAIVSRELGVPCIVNTKIATSSLKDGDQVEVDAQKGVVKKI